MAADTVVLPPENPPTRRLPVPGVHPLNLTSCVVEVSALLLGFSVLRARMRPIAGDLTVDDDGAVLRVELAGVPVRANLPMIGRLFRRAIPGAVRLAVELPDLDLSAGGVPIRVDGTVAVKPANSDETERPHRQLRMAARVIPTENDVVVLAISGRVLSPRKPPKSPLVLSVLRSRMRAEAAMEFTRCSL
ncbi:MAG TPA: hypothetical protein VJ914_05750 [Pseudonocardiaceae bacterium]|nr:hypothetical protein [Pseudonocardiaceae bacterium]